jgi:hypothetical protein
VHDGHLRGSPPVDRPPGEYAGARTTTTCPVNPGAPMTGAQQAEHRRLIALALLASTRFVIVLDAAIVNVAIPSIGDDLTTIFREVPSATKALGVWGAVSGSGGAAACSRSTRLGSGSLGQRPDRHRGGAAGAAAARREHARVRRDAPLRCARRGRGDRGPLAAGLRAVDTVRQGRDRRRRSAC